MTSTTTTSEAPPPIPVDFYKEHAKNKPNELALIDDFGVSYTWQHMVSTRNKLVSALKQAGIQSGEHVITYALNCCEFVIISNALNAMGVVAIPMNWRLTEEEVKYIVNDVSPSLSIF
jgi:fatty-acyl-CoA synthase